MLAITTTVFLLVALVLAPASAMVAGGGARYKCVKGGSGNVEGGRSKAEM